MNNIDFIFAFSFIALLGVILAIFIRGKKINISNQKHIILKLIPVLFVVFTIITVFIINDYYKKQLKLETEKYKKNSYYEFLNHNLDSLIVSKNYKLKTLDSLKEISSDLNDLLKKIEKQQNIIGEQSNLIQDVKRNINRTRFEIEKIESYNEILDKDQLLKKRKGYFPTNTSNFEFYCPNDNVSDYIDLKLKFITESLVDKIGYIYIDITEIRDNKYYMIFDQTYIPKKGFNAFKIKNYLKSPNMTLSIGYVLKSEMQKDFPRFEKVDCHSYK